MVNLNKTESAMNMITGTYPKIKKKYAHKINQLEEEQKKIKKTFKLRESKKNYSTEYASINLPFDESLLHEVKRIIAEKRKLSIDSLVVIGIGGSNLGTIAIHQSINGLLYNEQKPPIKLYFADSVDPTYTAQLITTLEEQFQREKNILLNIVTKSGSTTETIANAQVFIEALKEYTSHYQDYIVITTDKNSPLDLWAQKEKIATLHIPKNVGGRYSVFSSVGLFPLGMIGIDIDQLQTGAQAAVKESLTTTDNLAFQSALAIYQAYEEKLHIHDLFIFAQELEGVGKWYRQLSGESLGKELLDNPKKQCSLTPTISIGSADLHSVTQLYLGGLPPTFTTFISIEQWRNLVTLPINGSLSMINPAIQNKSLNEIMNAIAQGTMTAYKKQKKVFGSCIIPEISAYYIGNLLQTFMIQMMYLGNLFNVNPFNQPHVELYKKEIKRILTHA